MTYKPSGPNDSTHGRKGRKGEEGGERGDGGRGWIVGMSCIKRESGGGDSSWTLEGLSEAMDSRKRRGWVGGGRGRDVTHARGTVNASAIRQMHETPPPLFRVHQISPTTLLYLPNVTFSSSTGAWMQSANVKCNICLSTYLHSSTRIPPPPPTDEPSLGSLFPRSSRSHFSVSYLLSIPLTWSAPVYVFIVCA